MKAIKWLLPALLLAATPMAGHSEVFSPKMYQVTGSGTSARTRGIPAVFTNLRTSPGDSIVAIQRTRNYSGVLEFRGDSTWLAPGTTILTNAKVGFYDRALIGDPNDKDLRPVRVVASGLRTDESSEGGTIDRNAGIKVYGYLRAHRLEVTGFNNPPYGGANDEGEGTAIIVQHGGWIDMYDSYTSGNIGGLMVPSWGDAPPGSRISIAQTWRCAFKDSMESLAYNSRNRAVYRDEYSRFYRRIILEGQGSSAVGPDSLDMLKATFFGSTLPTGFPTRFYLENKVVEVTKSADLDDDGWVGFVDFFMFATHFGRFGGLDAEEAACDLDGDGRVDFADFFFFAGQFGRATKPTTLVALAKPVVRQPTLEQIEFVRLFLDQHLEFMSLLPADIKAVVAVDNSALPRAFSLGQNFPNPFNPVTTIVYSLGKETDVRLIVYGLTGQVVRTLVSTHQAAGRYAVTWDGTDNSGQRVANGPYFYKLQAGAYGDTRRLLLLK